MNLKMNGVFIDSNVILRHLSGDHHAKQIIDLIEEHEITGFVNQIVISEVLYVYMKLTTKMTSYQLKSSPAIIKKINLTPVLKLLSLMDDLPSHPKITMLAVELIQKVGLLPNDAFIAATCKHFEIKTIATFDEDFKNVEFLTIYPIE